MGDFKPGGSGEVTPLAIGALIPVVIVSMTRSRTLPGWNPKVAGSTTSGSPGGHPLVPPGARSQADLDCDITGARWAWPEPKPSSNSAPWPCRRLRAVA